MVADVKVAVPWFCNTTSTGIGPAVGMGAAIPTISLMPASTAAWSIFLGSYIWCYESACAIYII